MHDMLINYYATECSSDTNIENVVGSRLATATLRECQYVQAITCCAMRIRWILWLGLLAAAPCSAVSKCTAKVSTFDGLRRAVEEVPAEESAGDTIRRAEELSGENKPTASATDTARGTGDERRRVVCVTSDIVFGFELAVPPSARLTIRSDHVDDGSATPKAVIHRLSGARATRLFRVPGGSLVLDHLALDGGNVSSSLTSYDDSSALTPASAAAVDAGGDAAIDGYGDPDAREDDAAWAQAGGVALVSGVGRLTLRRCRLNDNAVRTACVLTGARERRADACLS